jgi:polar amino acid transport system substrate-binding protein
MGQPRQRGQRIERGANRLRPIPCRRLAATGLLPLRLGLVILVVLLTAVRCPQSAPPTPDPLRSPPPEPTIVLIPPIARGDGTDLIDQLLATGIIRVGIRVWPEAAFAPPAFRGFSNATTGGALNGFEVDLAHLLAEGLGLELELVEAYPPVIASGDWRGEWDIGIASLVPFDQPTEPSSSRAVPGLIFSEPYAYMPMGILVPASENGLGSVGDLSGRKVGVLADSPYEVLVAPRDEPLTVQGRPVLAAALPGDIEIVPESNLLKTIRLLGQPAGAETTDVAAVIGPAPILQEAVNADLPVKLGLQAQNLGYQPLAVAAVPRDGLKVDRLIVEINNVLDRLQRRGILAEVYQRWYRQDLSRLPDSEEQE